MQSAREWYQVGNDDQQLTLAHEAFKKALGMFDSNITKDPRKRSIAKGSTSIQELEQVVKDAKSKYEHRHKDHRVGKWLTRISHRVRYYGKIGDVLVQQYPEYVSLAWGAFKLLLSSTLSQCQLVENQENLVTTLAKGLSQVSDSLPRIELSTILYPTQRMKEAVAQLYAHIINFLIRAKDWYEEGKLRHALNAFARPAKLRYDDIIQDIEACTKEIDQISTASARAEQRDIHLELQELRRRQEDAYQRDKESKMVIFEIRKLCTSSQSLQSTSFLDTSKRLTDLQLKQIMDNLAQTRKLDPLKSLQLCYYAYRTSGSNKKRETGLDAPFWYHPKFNNWKSPRTSAVIMVKGDYKTREEVKGFTVNIVRLLCQEDIPVVWALKSPHGSSAESISTVDVLKDLVCQILRLNISLHTERLVSLSCAQFRTAETPEQWFDLLATLLDKLALLYIVIDIEAVSVDFVKSMKDFSWISSFSTILQSLSNRQIETKLKVLLVSYGSASLQEPKLALFPDLVITTRQSVQSTFRGRGKYQKFTRRGRNHLR